MTFNYFVHDPETPEDQKKKVEETEMGNLRKVAPKFDKSKAKKWK